jgi:putative membrane protein
MAHQSQTPQDPDIMQDLSQPSTPMEYARLFFSGFAMGASDIVPGVSGGTMAFILGVYETLLNAIKSFNIEAIQKFFGLFGGSDGDNNGGLKDLANHLHLRFLIALGTGLLAAVALLSALLETWLNTHPMYVFAFFGGLIIASVLAIGLKVKWSTVALLTFLGGVIFAFLVTNPALGTLGDAVGHGYPVLFISGAIAICAMILPGISGSFILLILGQYEYILGAVKDRDIVSLLFVATGAAIGLLFFSRILSWLLDRYENATIAVLVGFMLGSMRLIVYRATHSIPEEGDPVALVLSGQEIAIALGLALVGFLLVSFLDHMQGQNNPVFRIFGGKPVEDVVVTES